MLIITLDIETISPGWDGGKTKTLQMTAQGWEPVRAFPPLPYHQPVVISMLAVDSDDKLLELSSYRLDEYDEKTALIEISEMLSRADRLVSYNGRGFDMPLLTLRAMVHAADLGYQNDLDWRFWDRSRHRFGNYKQALFHYDLSDQLTDFGGAPRFSLDALATMLGLPGKSDIDGSQVGELWKDESERDRIVRYCEADVMDTWLCYAFWDSIFLKSRGINEMIKETRQFIADDDFLSDRYRDFLKLKTDGQAGIPSVMVPQ